MSGEMYQVLDLDRYFRTYEPDARREILELAKSLANHITAKAAKTHSDSCGILNTKDIVSYLLMEAKAEIYRTLIDLV